MSNGSASDDEIANARVEMGKMLERSAKAVEDSAARINGVLLGGNVAALYFVSDRYLRNELPGGINFKLLYGFFAVGALLAVVGAALRWFALQRFQGGLALVLGALSRGHNTFSDPNYQTINRSIEKWEDRAVGAGYFTIASGLVLAIGLAVPLVSNM